MLVLFPCSVWNSNYLEGGVINTRLGREAKSLKTGNPLPFPQEGIQLNKQKIKVMNPSDLKQGENFTNLNFDY